MTKKNGKFISKAESILKGQFLQPQTMDEFITGSAVETDESPEREVSQLHKSAFTQKHIATSPQGQNPGSVQTERLHVHIRRHLADKLLEAVIARKRDPKHKRKDASQRAIIEEAMEEYFRKCGI